MNLFAVIDLTIPRLKRTLFLGTRWGEEHAQLIPAPGDPYYLNYTYDPLNAPLASPPRDQAAPPDATIHVRNSATLRYPPARCRSSTGRFCRWCRRR